MARKQEDAGNRGQGDRTGTPDAGGATSPSHCCYQSCQGDRKGTPLQYTNATALAYIVGAYPCGRPDCLSQVSSREKVEWQDERLRAESGHKTSLSTRFSSQGDRCCAVAGSLHSGRWHPNTVVRSRRRPVPWPTAPRLAPDRWAGSRWPDALASPAPPPAVATGARLSVPAVPASDARPRNSAIGATRCYSRF